LGKTERPKANNSRVLKPYSEAQLDLFRRGYNKGRRPSGHVIGDAFSRNNGGAIPPNLIEVANTGSQDSYQQYCREHGLEIHPARFPKEIPEFFIKFLTDPRDTVLDPFGGSNMTGAVAEELKRRWITFELNSTYLEGSVGRFNSDKVRDLRPDPPRLNS
jgi:DNA modification methylase